MPMDSNPPVEVYIDPGSGDAGRDSSKWPHGLIKQVKHSHRRLPGIRKIPLRAIAIIFLIAFINVLVWIAAAVVLVGFLFQRKADGRLSANVTYSVIIRMCASI